MSRRKAADGGSVSIADDGTSPLPTFKSDNAIGKQRNVVEKFTRFFRTRPVSSFLLVLGLIALGIVTFWLGRTVGRTFSHLLYPHHRSNSPPLLSTSHSGSHDNQQVQNVGRIVNEQNSSSNSSAGSQNDDAWLPPASDERGALVDGATDSQTYSDQGTTKPPPVRPRVCYRKFEPGKLGFEKTLCVTDEYYFDISVGDTAIGRFKVGVFGEVVPKSAANFRALVTCSGVFADDSLCFRGDTFHRVVTNFVAQGGSKATGRSIYGATFREEKTTDHHSFLEHGEKGVVSWAEYPIGSQFFVLLRNEAKYLDDNHVVFGIITDGLEVVDRIHDAPRSGEEPSSRVIITDCGDAHPSKPK